MFATGLLSRRLLMGGRSSRTKGASAERSVARILAEYGFNGERNGRNGITSEDVVHSLPSTWIEVKRREKLAISEWLKQAEGDAPEGYEPAVVFRKSREPWRIIVTLTHYLELQQKVKEHSEHHSNQAIDG
jgi:Holliday junction resolvase